MNNHNNLPMVIEQPVVTVLEPIIEVLDTDRCEGCAEEVNIDELSRIDGLTLCKNCKEMEISEICGVDPWLLDEEIYGVMYDRTYEALSLIEEFRDLEYRKQGLICVYTASRIREEMNEE